MLPTLVRGLMVGLYATKRGFDLNRKQIGFIVLVGSRITRKTLPDVNVWSVIREAYRNGKKAAWLPQTDWEAMLAKPLPEVRSLLRIAEPRAYREAEPIALAAEEAFKAMRSGEAQAVAA